MLKTLLKSKIFWLVLVVLSLGIWGYLEINENALAKKYGGTIDIDLKKSEVFMNATFKDDNVWYLVEDTVKKEYQLKEYSKFGILTGKVVFHKPEKE